MADLLNTFCHIHTPLLISTIRALLGWIIGSLAGIALYFLLHRVMPVDAVLGRTTAHRFIDSEAGEEQLHRGLSAHTAFAYSHASLASDGSNKAVTSSYDAPAPTGVGLNR